jgi:hypothetical protein
MGSARHAIKLIVVVGFALCASGCSDDDACCPFPFITPSPRSVPQPTATATIGPEPLASSAAAVVEE